VTLDPLDDQRVLKTVKTIINETYDLTVDIPIRCYLLESQDTLNQAILLIVQNHIVTDHGGDIILPNELKTFYNKNTLPDLSIQYLDYAIHEHNDKLYLEEGLNYWQKKLTGAADNILALPLDIPRAVNRPAAETGLVTFSLSSDIVKGIKDIMKKKSTTLFTVLYAVLNILLFQYSRETDILVGTVVANRTRCETAQLLGFFVNTVVLRSQVEPDSIFESYLSSCIKNVSEMLQYQDIPFNLIVDKLVKRRNPSVRPFFQVLMNIAPTTASRTDLPFTDDLTMKSYPLEMVEEEHFDLSWIFSDEDEFHNFSVAITFLKDIFHIETIQTMAQHFEMVCKQIFVDKDNCPISFLKRLLPSEVERIRELNSNYIQWDTEGFCVPDLFLKASDQYPNETCLIMDNGETVKYHEFKSKALALATYLQSLGITTDLIVGLFLESTLHLTIGTTSILLSGGGYCPLDIENPDKRLLFLLEDTKSTIILTETKFEEKLRNIVPKNVTLILMDTLDYEQLGLQISNWKRLYSRDSLAYCLYTSGTTGNPKGVLIEHRAMHNFCLSVEAPMTPHLLKNDTT